MLSGVPIITASMSLYSQQIQFGRLRSFGVTAAHFYDDIVVLVGRSEGDIGETGRIMRKSGENPHGNDGLKQ